MNKTNEIYCFICGGKFRLEKIKQHLNLCKSKYENNNHIDIYLPQEYEDLIDDMKYGLYPSSDKISEINNKMFKKSIKFDNTYKEQKQQYKDY